MISVLHVDDEESILDLTKIFLERTGKFRIDTVTSPHDALKLLEEEPFDALVSDYEMPAMNGLQLLEEVRRAWEEMPFIIFTGKGREDVVIRAFDLGADFYLQKGGDPKSQFAELAHKINHAVQRRKANLALRSSEEKFSKAFALNPICMAIADYPANRFVDVNAIFLESSQLSREEVIGKSAAELGLFADPSSQDRILEAFKNGGKIQNVEMESIRKNGETMTKLMSADLFRMGDATYILSYAVDITERKRYEKELKARDAILHAIAVSAKNLIGARDHDRAITETLRALGSAVGVDRVYIYTSTGEPDHLAKLAYEWVAEGAEPWIDNPRHTMIPYRKMGYSDNAERLKRGEIVIYTRGVSHIGRSGETPAKELCNTAIIPIVVGNSTWGVIGFETTKQKEWLPGVLDAMKTAASLISTAIDHTTGTKNH